jgi:hypothetical protein
MKTSKKPNVDSQAWYGNRFSILPIQAVLDSRLGPRHLKVLLFLAHHANRDGEQVYPGQDRIAEACGWYLKGKPNHALVSALISNPNWDQPKADGGEKKDTGPGLVEFGYVQKLGQRGTNKTMLYRLCVPQYKDGDLNALKSRKISNADYAIKRAADEESIFAELAVADNAKADALEKELEAARKARGAFIYRGTEYVRAEVEDAYNMGDWGHLPRQVVEHYGYSWSFIDGEF